jgi:hypothetical protein
MPAARPQDYFKNDGLFAGAYFDRVLANPGLPSGYHLPADAALKLNRLRALWRSQRPNLIRDVRATGKVSRQPYVGLPPNYEPLPGNSESQVENQLILQVCTDILGYSVVQNRHLMLQGAAAEGIEPRQRPDMVLFPDADTHTRVTQRFGGADGGAAKTPDGVAFCRSASFILDAKRFNKGVGADEDVERTSKRQRVDATAMQDVQQVARYLQGYDKRWGVLTNGRSWRLMRQGRDHAHLRFDLVLFLEDLGDREPDESDLLIFGLFWHLFGKPAVAGGYLDALERESEATNRRVREVLREQAHRAVESIARGFWGCADNGGLGLTVAPTLPPQAELDHLREVSLTLLYRLLFVMKAEAQSLLPMRDSHGALSNYARRRSSESIYRSLVEMPVEDRARFSDTYDKLQSLFRDIDMGSASFGIPAYNGGLFDPEKHPELTRWKLLDASLFEVLTSLIYLDGNTREAVPYADLDVRDLGDIYEGLLEQRLTAALTDPPSLHLRNQRGERKGSGSYFTPDALVDHLVRRALTPLLEACGDDATKVLALRVLDPAMGSGHFLVKAVDVMADHLTVRCDPIDADAPRDNGPAERAYWKRRVVESCLYGVDYNPMAVELARVSLWLHSAEYGRPLSFVDHHLKVGNSLVGATLDRLSAPGLRYKSTKGGGRWVPAAPPPVEVVPQTQAPTPSLTPAKKPGKRASVPVAQIALPFPIDTNLFSGILGSIRSILARPSNSAQEVKAKSVDYARAVERRLAAHRLLADLWCLQWFIGEPNVELVNAYEHPDGLYAKVKRICGQQLDERREAELAELQTHPLVQRLQAARIGGYGPRLESFVHWQLTFPEVAFGADGAAVAGFGFDAVIGNPPWDRLRPERRHFYGPYGRPDEGPAWDVANTQGASLERLIQRLHKLHPGLEDGWAAYEQGITSLNEHLRTSGVYTRQVVELDGKKTGGDPDTFRYFVERAFHAARSGGRVALIVPGTLWQAEGCTGLRQLLLSDVTTEEIYVFENYRKWAFEIDSRFKFTTFVATHRAPGPNHMLPAAFMLRDLRVVHGKLPERVVRLSRALVERLSPGTLSLLDLQGDADAQLVRKLHAEHPALGDSQGGWGARYRCELHMTNDAWRFKSRDWMKSRGFLRVCPEPTPNGWTQRQEHGSKSASYPSPLPLGGEYWVAADAAWYQERGYVRQEQAVGDGVREVFVHPDDLRAPALREVPAAQQHQILPGERYTALYEGRMVHNLDHAQKAYVRGEGRRAVWEDAELNKKQLCPRVFVCSSELAGGSALRVGFCDVTGATNERSTLAALIPQHHFAGNKVPTLVTDSVSTSILLAGVMSSFVWDWALRFRISTTMNWTYVSRVVLPSLSAFEGANGQRLRECILRVNATTPELASAWNEVFPSSPWTYESAERDPWRRGVLRAEIDAIIAELYGLSVPEYARVLTGFPLLDRDQPALTGDAFVTDASVARPSGAEGVAWEQNTFGVFERKPRSFITRDLALLTFMRRRGYAPPQDLHEFFTTQVGLDPDGPLSKFRIGSERDLIDRVSAAKALGAVPYVPSGRGGVEQEAAEEVEEEG